MPLDHQYKHTAELVRRLANVIDGKDTVPGVGCIFAWLESRETTSDATYSTHSVDFCRTTGRVLAWNCPGDYLPADTRASFLLLNSARCCRSNFVIALRNKYSTSVRLMDTTAYRMATDRILFTSHRPTDLEGLSCDAVEALLYQIIPTITRIFRDANSGAIHGQLFSEATAFHSVDWAVIEVVFAFDGASVEMRCGSASWGDKPSAISSHTPLGTDTHRFRETRIQPIAKTQTQLRGIVNRLTRLGVAPFRLKTTVEALHMHTMLVRAKTKLPSAKSL